MGIRDLAGNPVGGTVVAALDRVNARHPWSHNDAFHPWILDRLPRRRSTALDVGCGRGELLAALAPTFDRVLGIDTDPTMRRAAMSRCAGHPNVRVDGRTLDEVHEQVDLVTMVAVLHHLDLDAALADVRRLLLPGGRFLCVGLARPESVVDQAWDLASAITNPVIGIIRHPRPDPAPPAPPPFPVAEPRCTLDEIRTAAERALPGVVVRRHLGFRHTLTWTAPKNDHHSLWQA